MADICYTESDCAFHPMVEMTISHEKRMRDGAILRSILEDGRKFYGRGFKETATWDVLPDRAPVTPEPPLVDDGTLFFPLTNEA